MTPSLEDRLRGAIWGQLVGDAAALGTHWIYDLDELRRAFPEIKGFETPREGHYHFGKKPGEFTHYGDAAFVMLVSVAEHGRFDAADFGKRFVGTFGSPDYKGYLDHATKGTLENHAAFEKANPGKPFDFQQGADDDQLATASSLAPVVVAHFRDSTLIETVKRATLVRQNNVRAVAYNRCHALILKTLLDGGDFSAALQRAETFIANDAQFGAEIRSKVHAAVAAKSKDVTEATKELGQSCPLDKSFPSALQCALRHSTSFSEAILATIRAGGDNAGRAAMIGAWLGAHLGVNAIPVEWQRRLGHYDQIHQWVERLVFQAKRRSNPDIEDLPSTPASKARLIQWTFAVAVIVLLVGMCAPALSAAREKARRASCMCNLKQIGLSMRLYSGDHGEWFPCDTGWTVIGTYALLTNNYQTSLKTWLCPSDGCGSSGCGLNWGGGKDQNPFITTNFGYAYGAFGLNEQTQPDTPLACDRSSGDIRRVKPYVGNTRTHKEDGGNILYADGHVAWTKTFVPPMYRGKNP